MRGKEPTRLKLIRYALLCFIFHFIFTLFIELYIILDYEEKLPEWCTLVELAIMNTCTDIERYYWDYIEPFLLFWEILFFGKRWEFFAYIFFYRKTTIITVFLIAWAHYMAHVAALRSMDKYVKAEGIELIYSKEKPKSKPMTWIPAIAEKIVIIIVLTILCVVSDLLYPHEESIYEFACKVRYLVDHTLYNLHHWLQNYWFFWANIEYILMSEESLPSFADFISCNIKETLFSVFLVFYFICWVGDVLCELDVYLDSCGKKFLRTEEKFKKLFENRKTINKKLFFVYVSIYMLFYCVLYNFILQYLGEVPDGGWDLEFYLYCVMLFKVIYLVLFKIHAMEGSNPWGLLYIVHLRDLRDTLWSTIFLLALILC